jgi:hypothetical protein
MTIKKTTLFVLIVMAAGLLLSPSGLFAQNTEHNTITQELITLLEEKPEIEVMLKESLEKAKSINPDIVTNPAQDLQSYYTYIGRAAQLIPNRYSMYRRFSYATRYCKASAIFIF